MSIEVFIKQGELQMIDRKDLAQPVKQIWAKMNDNLLECYQNNVLTRTINVSKYSYISDRKRGTEFKLTSRDNGSVTFNATSVSDKNQWIECIEEYIPKGRGTTVREKNDLESACTVWFICILMAMMIFIVLGCAVNMQYYNIACIPISLYEFTIIVSCSYYCRKLWQNIKGIMKINKFWIQSFGCFMFNIISFLLMVINLSINFKDRSRWYYAHSIVCLLGAFSIPFPAICIKLRHQYKFNEHADCDSIEAPANAPITSALAPSMPTQSPLNESLILEGAYNNMLNELKNNSHLEIHNEQQDESHEPVITAQQDELGDDPHDESELEEIKQWLTVDVGLPQYYDTFVTKQGFTNVDMIFELTDDELKEIIPMVGHRKMIKKCIRISTANKIYASAARSVTAETAVTSVAAAKPIFRDNILKGLICACYAAHIISYIGFPAIRPNSYRDINNIMYNNQSSEFYIVLYNINQIFLRTFMGMSLSSVFFTFVTELTDKQIAKTHFWVLLDIWKDQGNATETQKIKQVGFWIFMLLLFVALLPFEFLEVRKHFRSHHPHFHIDLYVNAIWIGFNGIGVSILITFLRDFGGIYDKTKYNYKIMFQEIKSPTSPIKAFVLESLLLFSLYLVYIVFLAIHIVLSPQDDINWDIGRQATILVLLFFQFITLIRIKQIQKFGGSYLESFTKRSTQILHRYYKYMSLILIYNISYIFIFKIEYFGLNSSQDGLFQHIAYAFSFSLSALLMFILSHLVSSYQRWIDDQKNNKDKRDEGVWSAKRHPNKNLDIFKAKEKLQRSASVDSLLVNGP